MSQSTQLSSRIGTKGTAQLHAAIEGFKSVLDVNQRQDFESSNDQPDAATVLKFTAHLDEINSERQSRCIATRLHKVLQSVQQFSTVVETFVSSNPKIAALVWGSFKFALLIASDFGTYFEKLSALFMKFGRHCPRYAEYQSLYLYSAKLQSCLCSFYATLVSCCAKAVEIMKRPGWAQFARIITLSSFESDFGTLEHDLQHWSREIKEEITVALHTGSEGERRAQSEERARAEAYRTWHKQIATEAKEKELKMERLRSTQQKQSLIDKLSDHDYNRPRTRARRQCVTSTGQWLSHAQQYKDWTADSTSSLLCLTGKLGSGKTTITASAIEGLPSHSASGGVIAYFFCRFDDEASLHATTILSSLLKQILRPESLSPHQQSSLEKMLDPGPPELTDLESLLEDTISSTQFIVIDAFDECNEDERCLLLKSLQKIMELPGRTVKLFLSSRDGDGWRIKNMFQRVYFVSTKSPESSYDLRAMVKVSLIELVEKKRLVVGHPDMLQEIEDHLLDKAHGMFLWVYFALQDLCSQLCDCDLRAALRRLPIGLPEMYDRLLSRIHNSGERRLVPKVFRWVACARRPLSLEELREAITIEPLQKSSEPDRYVNEITRIPSWSRGLVVCDEEDDVLQFAHSTIKDFLLGACRTEANFCFHFEADAADHELGEICVTYLNFSDFERQLTKRSKPPVPVQGQDLLQANINVTSGQIGISRTVSKASQLACEFLRRRDKTDARFTLPQQKNDTTTLQIIIGSHHFFQYASVYWIFHCKNFTQSTSTWSLWNRLLRSESSMIKTEWSPEEFSRRDECIRRFVEEQQHYGLLEWVQTSEQRFEPKQLGEIFDYSTKRGSIRLAAKILEQHEAAPVLRSPMVKAMEQGEINMVLNLLDAVSVPPAEDLMEAIIHIAAEKGHSLVFQRLVNAGADVNTLSADHERTLLQTAARCRDSTMVELLLEKKANVNARPTRIWGTALQESAGHGKIQIVRKLLTAGAEVNALAAVYGGRTALQMAAEKGHVLIVEILLNAGAKVNAPAVRDDGRTALQAAAEQGHILIVEMLLNAGADVNAEAARHGGRTVLQAAAEQGYIKVVEMLLNKGANINALSTDLGGRTALQVAAGQGYILVVKMLLDKGAHINARPAKKDGRTALQAAAECGNIRVVEVLLNKGADVNALPAEEGGKTALVAAAEQGHVQVVKMLLDAGADVSARGAYKETALQMAVIQDNHEVAGILRERGAV